MNAYFNEHNVVRQPKSRNEWKRPHGKVKPGDRGRYSAWFAIVTTDDGTVYKLTRNVYDAYEDPYYNWESGTLKMHWALSGFCTYAAIGWLR